MGLWIAGGRKSAARSPPALGKARPPLAQRRTERAACGRATHWSLNGAATAWRSTDNSVAVIGVANGGTPPRYPPVLVSAWFRKQRVAEKMSDNLCA